MKEILPGVFEWSWFSKEKGYDFNGHLIIRSDQRVLIDPPPMTKDDEARIDKAGPLKAIIITNMHHLRESEYCRKRFGGKITLPEADRGGIDVKLDATYKDADRLPCDLEAVVVPDNKTPGETALYLAHERGGVWILGDALIGHPAGQLSLMQADKYKDITKAKEGTRVLLSKTVEVILVGDGTSILSDGHAALTCFLGKTSDII